MRKALTLVTLLLVGAAAEASAGRLSPGLERMLAGMNDGDEISVLVVLRDQADVATLDAALHANRALRAERHAVVVEALQEAAARSQGPILQDLAVRRERGAVRGYTSYWIVNALTVATTVEGVRELARRPDVDVIEPDLEVELIRPVESDPSKAPPGGSVTAIGITPGVVAVQARRVWEELGIDGTGAIVGNMDTGVDGTHPALSARWRGNFAPASECWRDGVAFGDATPVDRHYHGTHVMGTITGRAPNDTIGVAPGALWIADNSINQSTGSAFDNDVLASLQWFADPDGNPGTTAEVPDVVQNSWGVNEGFSGYFDCDSRWWTAIDNCEAAGVVLTWSAGNEGPGGTSLRSPADRAASPYNCFSVGSTITTSPYTISDFSSRGPSGCGGAWAMKPEVCAPGSSIYSAQPGGGYQYLSGTSMAGPHVAGVVALMRSANPDVDVETIKQILMDTATDLGPAGEDNTYGHGFVNAYDAVLAVLSGYGRVEGTITDVVTGNPIPGATIDVLADPRAVTADGSGFFRIPLPAGSWSLEYRAFGYLTDTQTVEVLADLTADGSFAMTPAPQAVVSGVVRDYTNAPVGGAQISVLGTPLAPVASLPDGSYSISVPDGATYSIRARKDGLGSDVRSVVVAGATTQDFVLPELTWEDFESGDFLVWPWVMSGTAPWTIDTGTVYEGNYSAKSGAISHNQTTSMELTLTLVDPGNVSFWYTVSSEATFDFLRFYVDGVQVGSWSGSVPWTRASYPVANGSHTFRWSYTKDGSVSTGGDAAWVDLIDFPTIGTPAYPEISVDPTSLALTLGPDGTGQLPITLSNTGDGVLEYSVSVVSAPAPAAAKTASKPSGTSFADDLPLGKGEVDPRVGEPPLLGSGGPDAFGYRWVDSDDPGGPAYSWVEISGVGTPLSMGDDTYSAAIPVGFSFPFYGNTYTTVRVSSNGFVSFSSPSGSYYTNGSIPSATDPDDMVAAYWDDLNPNDGGTIYTYQDAANSRFIVEWDAVPRYGTGGSQRQTFQIILNADGSVVTQYETVTNATSCTVGIENADGTDGLQVVFNAAYLHDSLAIRFGTEPPIAWLAVSPLGGTVEPQGVEELTAHFDATGMDPGVYDAVVRIATNDQDEPVVDVPVTLTVAHSTGVEVTAGLPAVFSLGRPEPNPTASRTSIGYAVPQDGSHVRITLFDVGGRVVRTLVDGVQPAGRHVVTWDGRDAAGGRVASGVYFYRMSAGTFSQVRKVTLLK